jgi:HTH-type transcriptional regulator/antitoxin HigA
MDIKPIKNERDYEQSLRRVESLWKSPEGSPEGDELDALATLIEAYERQHFSSSLDEVTAGVRPRQIQG